MTTNENQSAGGKGEAGGQTVLDPFIDSGITGISYNNLNRKFTGFELLEEYYFFIAERRLQKVL